MSDADDRLARVVREQMRGSDKASVELVIAMSVLLARVAFADGRLSDGEIERVRHELAQVLGFGDAQIDAVCAVLCNEMEDIGKCDLEPHTDVLRERLDRHMRADVIKVLIELAAADRDIAAVEVKVIRAVAAKLLVDEALLQALLQRAAELAK